MRRIVHGRGAGRRLGRVVEIERIPSASRIHRLREGEQAPVDLEPSAPVGERDARLPGQVECAGSDEVRLAPVAIDVPDVRTAAAFEDHGTGRVDSGAARGRVHAFDQGLLGAGEVFAGAGAGCGFSIQLRISFSISDFRFAISDFRFALCRIACDLRISICNLKSTI